MTAASLLGPEAAPGDPLRLGFQVWSMGIAWPDLMAAGERVEGLGFSSLFANDHFLPVLGDADGPVVGEPGPVFEGWMVLAGFAAHTRRLPLGMMVAAVGYRNIGLTVKMVTALDHATDGRLMLGIKRSGDVRFLHVPLSAFLGRDGRTELSGVAGKKAREESEEEPPITEGELEPSGPGE